MADWRIVTPTRAPTSDELVNNEVFKVPKDGNVTSARIMYMGGSLVVQLFFSDPQVIVRYQFSDGKWLNQSSEPIDITTVDLTIPEEIVSAATVKTSYFDLIAYEKGTTACKLAVANEAKTLIRNAIINKGVTVPGTTPFRSYANKIMAISGGTLDNYRLRTTTGVVSAAGEINLYMGVDQLFWNDLFAFATVVITRSTGFKTVLGLVRHGTDRAQVVTSSGGIEVRDLDDLIRLNGSEYNGDYYWTVCTDNSMAMCDYTLYCFEGPH